jgi:hypothetical protein
MEYWTLVRFSLEEVRDGVATRLLRDFMSLALEDLREIGVFSSEVDFQGKCLYFSPCAAKAFASVLAKAPIELCDPPNPETLLCLCGAVECLPMPGKPVGCSTATGPPPPTPPTRPTRSAYRGTDGRFVERAAGWSSVQTQIVAFSASLGRYRSRHSRHTHRLDPGGYHARDRAVAQGIVGTVQGVGGSLRNVVAGLIVVTPGYAAAFLTLAAVAVAAMPETGAKQTRRLADQILALRSSQ